MDEDTLSQDRRAGLKTGTYTLAPRVLALGWREDGHDSSCPDNCVVEFFM